MSSSEEEEETKRLRAENRELRDALQSIIDRSETGPMGYKTAAAFADMARITLHGIDQWIIHQGETA